jgi:hypothetical protein
MRVRLMALLIFSVASLSISIADVRLPSIFSDNMVLQADTKVPIWGWAQPNEMVSVLIGNQKHSAVADSDGKWMIKLDELKSSSSLVKMIIQGENTLTIKNVLVGQVWIGSGQSNMWWPVKYAMDPNEEISNADFPSIRLFTVGKKISLIRIVHDVPGLKMKGLKNEDLPYEIRNFTNQGWGTTVRYEFNNDKGLVVTLARFNPQAKKMLLTTATIK